MKRTLFIITLLGLFLIAGAGATDDRLISGTVGDGTAGMPGVVVSDGYTVTTTDANGRFSIQSHPRAKFVFITVPATCEIPTTGNIPVFYRRIDRAAGPMQADFRLTPAPVKNEFTLIAIADPQPHSKRAMKRFADETLAELATVGNDFPPHTHFVGLTVGDLVWDAPEIYPDYVEAYRQIDFPCFQVIGNHDHDQKTINDDDRAAHYYEKWFGPTYYSFDVGQCHFIVLDNINYNGRKDYRCEITPEQYAWLKQDLSYVDTAKLIVVGMHAPSVFKNGREMNNRRELYALLERYEAFFISGHTHRLSYVKIHDRLRDFNLGAAFGWAWLGDIADDGTPNGYGVFKIAGNRLVNYYYKATGQPPVYQMRLFPAGAVAERPESVVVHIWGWHEGWKTAVYEDGVAKGEMRRYTGFDPAACDFFLGPDKPAERPKAEPAQTDNLFYYTPDNPHAKITITATDDFGNEYVVGHDQ